MEGEKRLETFFRLGRVYESMYELYHANDVIRTLNPNDKEFSGAEAWHFRHYFDVGADALRIIASSLIAHLRSVPGTILDFPSGSGRVTRHLKAFFVNSEITACDLYSYHTDFCRETLGVRSLLSKQNFDEFDFDQKYDLIFCGSLLTHLPERELWSAMRLVCRSLSATGLAIVTLHGRHSIYLQHNKAKYMSDELFAIAQSGFESIGFGYADYHQQNAYGIALVSPAYLTRGLQDDTEVRLLDYCERAWDNHHDVVVLGRPPINV
jgi:SAM-dependent methyltransferase